MSFAYKKTAASAQVKLNKVTKLFVALFYISTVLLFTILSAPTSAGAANIQTVSGYADEGWMLAMQAPDGAVFTDVVFASYGTPNSDNTLGWCHSETSVEVVFQEFVGKSSGSISATNNIFGDPCGGTYKRLQVVLAYEYVNPQPYLNAPTGLEVFLIDDSVFVKWSTPEDSGTAIERYAIFWTAQGYNGWAVASTETSIYIPVDVVAQAGFSVEYTFSIRSDNDSLGVYSQQSEPVTITVNEPVKPTPTPTPTVEPTPEPTPTVEPPSIPSPTPTPTESSEPTPNPEPTEEPIPNPEPEQPTTVEELLENLEEGQVVSSEQLAALGIDYSELPPDTPVLLENGVVLTAEIADALEVFESPSEILGTLFTDPSKALTAIANVGADLPADVRKKAQQAAVPAVIVTQVISGTAALLTRKI